MSSQRMLAVVLLVVGIVLIVMGANASHSVADQVTHTFTGHFTDATTWYILGGIGVAVVGLVMMAGGGIGKKGA